MSTCKRKPQTFLLTFNADRIHLTFDMRNHLLKENAVFPSVAAVKSVLVLKSGPRGWKNLGNLHIIRVFVFYNRKERSRIRQIHSKPDRQLIVICVNGLTLTGEQVARRPRDRIAAELAIPLPEDVEMVAPPLEAALNDQVELAE